MKLHDVIALTIKIAGLILLVISVGRMPEYVNIFSSEEAGKYGLNALYLVSPFLVIVGISLLFILYPYKVSNQLIMSPESASNLTEEINLLQIMAVRLLGLLLLFWSISDIVFHFFNYLMLRKASGVSMPLSGYNYPVIIATVAEIAFSVILLIKAKTISKYLNSREK